MMSHACFLIRTILQHVSYLLENLYILQLSKYTDTLAGSQVFVYLTGMSECRPVNRTMLHNKNSNVRIKQYSNGIVWNVMSYDTNMCFYITCV